MLKGFRDFLLRGNVIDLAVAVVIGSAFTSIINAIAAGFIGPLIALVFGEPNYSNFNTDLFKWGDILTAIINFLITAFVVYFFIVLPTNRALALLKRKDQAPTAPELTKDQQLLTEIRDLLRSRENLLR